jgi:hypothetical protein
MGHKDHVVEGAKVVDLLGLILLQSIKYWSIIVRNDWQQSSNNNNNMVIMD